MQKAVKNKRLVGIVAGVGVVALLLATGIVASLSAAGFDSPPPQAKTTSFGVPDETRIDAIVSAQLPLTADQTTNGCPRTSKSSSSSATSLSEIDDILVDKPVFLFFYADWCHYCHEQMPIIDEVEQEYAGKAAFVHINGSEKPRLEGECGVDVYPTVIIVSGKGDNEYEFERLKGARDKQGLEAALERGINQFQARALADLKSPARDMTSGPCEADNSDVGYFANPNSTSTKTKFEGTVIQNLSMIGEWHFVVSGLTWTGGVEPCADPIDVKKQVIEGCEGYVDPSVGVGHEVEVYGDLPFGGCWVSLCESDSYIIKKTAAECCPCQITTRDPTAELGYPHPAHHTDVIVHFAPQCSDTVCGRVTACYPWVHIEGCGIHGIDYYVLAENPIPYNELSGYVGKYIRLTGVVIESYGVLGDPFIGGYSTVEEISGCSVCQSERCDPASFTALLHEPPDTATNITDDFYRYTQGIYRATLPAGDTGNKTIEVSAPNCTTIERELHLVGSTICGQVDWGIEWASIEGCDGLTYPVATCDGLKWQELHDRLEEYDGENVLLSSVVFEGYYDANIPCIADFDHIEEIQNCAECDSDKFIDGCTEISSSGNYKLMYDIHESDAQECIRITASDVSFDGNGHYISAAEIIDGGGASQVCRSCCWLGRAEQCNG